MPVNETPPENSAPDNDRSGEIKALEQKWIQKNRQVQPPPSPDQSAGTAGESEPNDQLPG